MKKISLDRARRDFEQVLPRLVGDYESGRLVPFIGSGMSMGACAGWQTMIERLERTAFGRRRRSGASVDPTELIERGNAAVRALKSMRPGVFEQAMRFAVAQRDTIPDPTRALARVWWPLVLTTNYDNCYVAAFKERWGAELHSTVGRGSEDCQRVLTSLFNPGRPLLWALQGHMNVPCRLTRGDEARPDLEAELVVGHEEYRRVTYRDPGFRRAFAEVFRQRSLLFLGAGIRETYLQDLFGEVLEIYGPCSRPHYAILPQGEVDPEFLLARLQIRVIEFPKPHYEEVTNWLDTFVNAANAMNQRPVVWGFGGTRGSWANSPRLEILRGMVPDIPTPGACIAILPVQREGRFPITRALRTRMKGWRANPAARPQVHSTFVHEYAGAGVFVVRARAEAEASSLTAVYEASRALFDVAARRFDVIHMQLPGTGTARGVRNTGDEPLEPRLSFPARFTLIQTVRAWRDWSRRNPGHTCRLVLHTLAESVTMEIAAGRLDVLELLSCDDVRFATEVARDDEGVERRVFELLPRRTKLADIVDRLDLSPAQWTVEVSPRTNLHKRFRPERLVHFWADRTLHELGVVPGSTLHFRRARRVRQ
jgi:hypothetical protein